MYLDGVGVPKDPARSFLLLQAAGQVGLVQAQYNLGKMYRDGLGTAADLEASIRWFRLAAEQGYAKAQEKMAQRYASGKGVEQDPVEAMKWAILAARQDHEGAAALQAELKGRLSATQTAEAESRAERFLPVASPLLQ
jgi:hypothetical protein